MLTEFGHIASAERDAAAQKHLLSLGFRMPYTVTFADAEGNYHNKMRSRYMKMWDDLPVTPDELVATITEGITGGEDDLVLRDLYIDSTYEEGALTRVRLETKFVPGEYRENTPSYSPYLNNDREYDFVTGECVKGDIRTNGLKEPGVGRLAVRNALQLGYRLDCPRVRISATRVGCLLWLKGDAYDVESVNPEYLKSIRKRWQAVEPHITDEVDKIAIETAIEYADLKALAGYQQNMRMPLSHTSGGAFSYRESEDKESGIPLNRYLLFDYMIDCWEGISNMDDPYKRSELANLLGGWTDDALKSGSPHSMAWDRRIGQAQELHI